ncbi:Rad52/Rad22 family DNA repair protein [Anaeromyxobacter dehalogenans]|uniref:Rad52/22 double-strand break repair protein n=1 Tax=Anaeromyxobacter dehalogenans (strain 2CP-C) TaxID=290397 RepID=Q2IFG3_ANADE|nr:Rad52/Rad22 family DNA repair protein [Anaeromyxobacter dehalogenans]ABC83318.1 hypothetical protein Adeh_3552 [Anaeromyxobacter dehalogenans 2CP-C]
MNPETKKKLYQALCAPFPPEAIERTDGSKTGRGYNTSGVKVQWIIDRLNEAVGIGNWRVTRETFVHAGTTNSGRKVYEAWSDVVLQLGEWSGDTFVPFAEARAYGAHSAVAEGDSRKGAATNGIKRAAAMMGCGAAAYRGELDDDNEFGDQPVEESSRPPTHPTAQQNANRRVEPLSMPRLPSTPRNRLTSKQLSALIAISRKLGMDLSQFRQQVRSRYGTQIEFITKSQASELIGEMSNGGLHHGGDGEAEMAEPGAEG